jgi:hypothetical protein
MPYDELFDKVREAGVLVLDDLGAENATAWATEKLFQIINYRYNYRMPTVITTNHRLLSNGQRIHCELLRFDPGEALSLQLQLTTPGIVGRLVIAGDTCEEKDLAGKAATVIATSGSLAVSSAGGGEYWMAITATGAGDFVLTATTPAPTTKVQALPPATHRVLLAPKGTASTTAVEGTAPKAGTVIKDCETCPKVVVVPAGSFMMGSASTE